MDNEIPPERVTPFPAWLEAEKDRDLCPQCLCIRQDSYPRPLDIILKEAPSDDIEPHANLEVIGTRFFIWSCELLDKLEKHLSGFILGACCLPDGTEIQTHRTCYGIWRVTLRGSPQSQYHVCSVCQTILSSVRPGPEYVLARELGDSNVYQDALGYLYLTENIVWDLNLSVWDGVGRTAMAVRETPADGQKLPGDQ